MPGERFACTTARMKGTCNNHVTIRREVLEATVLDGLQHRLMGSDLYEIFCEEYTRHMNALRMQRNAAYEGRKSELGRVTKELDRLVRAIMDGVPGSQVKDKVAQLEARKAELEAGLSDSEEEPVRIHPNMAAYYRQQVGRLRETLNDEEHRAEATELIRDLIDKIVLTPETAENGRKTLSIDLHGDLAGILAQAANEKKAPRLSAEGLEQIKLVAGEGLEPPTRGL